MGKANTGSFAKGQSGNPTGRPKAAESLSETIRTGVKKRQIVERLFDIACGKAPEGTTTAPTISEQHSAIRTLLDRGFGLPFQMSEGSQPGDVHIQVTYVQNNRIEVASPASGPAESTERSAALQLAEGGEAIREVDVGPAPADQ